MDVRQELIDGICSPGLGNNIDSAAESRHGHKYVSLQTGWFSGQRLAFIYVVQFVFMS